MRDSCYPTRRAFQFFMDIKDKTIAELLEKFPDGFAIGPRGHISRILAATSSFAALANAYPHPPSYGGYLIVEGVDAEELENSFK